MSGIKALPANAVRLLGAGQAIQDAPAMIKELLDNAIDAQATNVSIEISSNMLDRLQVRDNGHGIPPGDRHLLCRRYCTSKISSEHDLNNIGGTSLGFRGEALSSIAASSGFMSVTTRTKEEPVSAVMTFDGQGNIISTTRASMAVGTVVKVVDFLKHNPVRHKTALAKASASLQKVKQMLQAYVCARPSIRLSLKIVKQDGKNDFLYVPGQQPSVLDAVTKLFGVRCASQCTSTDSQHGTVSMAAVLPKEDADSEHISSLGCFISCDGRPMSAARGTFKQIRTMFNEAVIVKGNPLLVLHIVCAPSMYDVNVEPAKDDVIFEDATIILNAAQQLFASVYKRFETQSSVARIEALPTPLPSSDAAEGRYSIPATNQCPRPVGTLTTHEIPRDDRGFVVERALDQVIASQLGSQASSSTPSQRGRSSFKPRATQRSRVNKPFVQPSVQGGRDRVWFDHLEPYEQARGAASQSTTLGIHCGSQRVDDSLGELLHDPRPLSPPRHNSDIRSFCQSLQTSRPAVRNGEHDDAHEQISPRNKPVSARLPSSFGPFVDEEFSAEVFNEVLAGRIDNDALVPATPPRSSLPPSAFDALLHVKHPEQQKPTAAKSATKQHREVSSQLLAWGILSSATKTSHRLEISVQGISELVDSLDISRSLPSVEVAAADYQMLWPEACTDDEIGSMASMIERRLEPCDPRRSTILRLKESIKQAIAGHLQYDAWSEVASSDADLLL